MLGKGEYDARKVQFRQLEREGVKQRHGVHNELIGVFLAAYHA